MKVMICVNDLLADEPGLVFGGKLANDLQAEIMLLHVLPKNKEPGDRDEAESLLSDASRILGDTAVQTKVRRGNVVKRIIKETERGKFDIVMITVSKIGEGRQPATYIHQALLRKLACCLLVIKNPRTDISRVLICTGGLRKAESVIEFGADIANVSKAGATLFHVAANVPSMYTGLKTIEETLSEMLQTDTPVARHLRQGAKILAEKDIQAEIKLRHGSAVYEIVRETDRENYDMVVVGASGADSRIKEWIYGNLAQEIVDSVGIPVMVVDRDCFSKDAKFNM